MTSSKALFYFCIAFILGIALESLVFLPQIIIWVFLLIGIFIILFSVLKNKNAAIVFGFCLLFFMIGVLWLQIFEFSVSQDTLSKLNDAPEKIKLTGTIIYEPEIRDVTQKLKVRVNDSFVLVTASRYPEYHYLDIIRLNGKLKTPAIFDEFNYKDYLMKDGIYSVMNFSSIEIIGGQSNPSIFSSWQKGLFTIKKTLLESIGAVFSPPESFIMEGIVFGNDKNTPQDLKDAFTVTGLSHVTAVSGSNMVILIEMAVFLLLALGFWRQQALVVALFFIWFYIALIGFPVSAIRAVIMGSVLLVAQILGRQNAGARVLVLAATLMIIQNPFLLRYDVSFQLSFLASLGIIYGKPFIDYYIKKITKERFTFWVDIISVTLASQFFTLPVIMYNFGRLSLVAPITNILVLPIIPWLTMLGFAIAVLGSVSYLLGFVISLPCLVLLAYFLRVITLFDQPWSVLEINHFSWIWFLLYYAGLVLLLWIFYQKKRDAFLSF